MPITHVGCVVVLCICLLVGCDGGGPRPDGLGPASSAAGAVPAPLTHLLPREIHLQASTSTRDFIQADGVTGLEASVKVLDHFEEPTHAFGVYRFELYEHRSHEPVQRGRRVTMWRIDAATPEASSRYWDSLFRAYQFPLHLDRPLPLGDRFVLVVVLENPYGPRLSDERTFVSGE